MTTFAAETQTVTDLTVLDRDLRKAARLAADAEDTFLRNIDAAETFEEMVEIAERTLEYVQTSSPAPTDWKSAYIAVAAQFLRDGAGADVADEVLSVLR